MGGSLLVVGLLMTWATPIWLIGLGTALGLAVMAVVFAVIYLISPRFAREMSTNLRDGVLLPILYLAVGLTAFTLAGTFLIPGLPYRDLARATTRISAVGPLEIKVTVPPSTHDFELTEMKLPVVELQSFTIETDQPVTIATNLNANIGQTLSANITPGNVTSWTKPIVVDRDRMLPPDPSLLTRWSATNVGDKPANLIIHAQTDIEFPEVRVVTGTAIALVTLVAIYLAMGLFFPKIDAIALTTAKEAISQPLFFVALVLGVVSLIAFIVIPYNTFGEDVKMLKDSGLTLIMVLAMIVAVWSASVSVSEEVEGRTALTVLSKPVRRRQFILGKFLGVLGPVVVLFVVLGVLFLITVSFKVVYDARESAKTEPTWQSCYLEMIRIVPGLALAFMETVVLAAISVAISTRLPMLANLLVCASVYVLGHLVPMLVNSSVGKFEIVRFVGQFIATVLPVLDNFNIQAAVAAGAVVPMDYLATALLYCLLYTTIAMLLGLAMFEDRDLA